MPTSQIPQPLFLDVQGHSVACQINRVSDNLTPIVFVHGIMMSANFWPLVIEGHPLVERSWASLSLPAHFPSKSKKNFRQADVKPELFAATVRAASEELFDGQPVHVVGWSTGGFTALVSAALCPENVASVTSICGFAHGQWGSLLGLMQRIIKLPLGRAAFRASMRLVAMLRFSLGLNFWLLAAKSIERSPRNETILDVAYEDFRRHDYQAISFLFAGLSEISIADLLPMIKVPVRIIGGEKDNAILLEETEFIATQIPSADLLTLSDVGHIFYAEAREEVLDSTIEWIRQHD